MTDRITLGVAGIVMLVALAGAATVAGIVQKQRDVLGLVVKMEGQEGMPPHVAVVTAALGTFRGLAVDILWARADHLQTEGEFYEAQTLAQWITTLQPRFQKVWGFQAWNLAWNITAATQVPAERWGWVNRGIELLRARGIPLNPQAANLYFDLAWIFQNKIGRIGDKQHWYYKARLAAEMQEILGDIAGGKSTDQVIQRFRAISDAPATLEELLQKRPAVQSAIELLAAHGAKPDEALLRMLGRALMATASLDARLMGRDSAPPGTNIGLLEAMRADRKVTTELIDHLLPHLQRRVLQERYRMDPTEMLAVMERYGPLDWRHPHPHGIYWSEQGVKVARNLERREKVNELMLVRGRLMMLMELLRTGRVELDAGTNRIDLLPDPRFARFYERAIQEAFDLISSEQGVSAAEFGLAEEADLFDGYEKFLNTATMFAYLYGDHEEAARYFGILRDLVDRRGFGDEPVYSDTLENFVAIRFADLVQVNLGDLRQVLDAMIRRAFVEGLALGNLKVFNRFLGVANTVYDRRFASSRPGEVFILEDAKLVEFPKIVENSFKRTMLDPGLSLLLRARIWSWAPEPLRLKIYDSVAKSLAEQAEAAGLAPERAFPAPSSKDDGSAERPVGSQSGEASADELKEKTAS